jgi:tetrapyrrole methylase family protein/MazG family protein
MTTADSLTCLVDIVKTLRGPNGCPWDKEQTFESLTPFIIEEAYELVDAMKSTNIANLEEELGDVLLHVVMLSLMAEEQGWFTLTTVARGISDKMIRRHPHVFGSESATTSADVLRHWDDIKRQEKNTTAAGLLDSIPSHLPAAMQAQKIQKKASKVGFDWPNTTGVIDKIDEELNELKEAVKANRIDAIQAEFGDVLFSVINLGRKLGIDCETALQSTNQKFRHRFKSMEALARTNDTPLDTLTLDQLEILWNTSKKETTE